MYVKSCDRQTKWMHFWIQDDYEWLRLWLEEVSVDIKIEFDSEPVYNKAFVKTKIKFYDDAVTDYYDKEILKVDSNHTFLAVIILDSAVKKDENYYL